MGYEVVEHHRNTGNATKDVLCRFTPPESVILAQLGIPVEYYADSLAASGLANTPLWMLSRWLLAGETEMILEYAKKYPLETPSGVVNVK